MQAVTLNLHGKEVRRHADIVDVKTNQNLGMLILRGRNLKVALGQIQHKTLWTIYAPIGSIVHMEVENIHETAEYNTDK